MSSLLTVAVWSLASVTCVTAVSLLALILVPCWISLEKTKSKVRRRREDDVVVEVDTSILNHRSNEIVDDCITLESNENLNITYFTKGRLFLFLVSLSIGSLVGDALVHLLPESFQMSSSNNDEIILSIAVLLGIYLSFVFEQCLSRWHSHHHVHHHHAEESQPISNESNEHNELTSLSILVLASDGLHNLLDGLALTLSFASSISLGLTTSFAILFHEIPHELGDYAILLSSLGGAQSLKRVFGYALLSNAFGYLGVVLGLIQIHMTADYRQTSNIMQAFVLAFTAGNFLYLALADLLPASLQLSETASSIKNTGSSSPLIHSGAQSIVPLQTVCPLSTSIDHSASVQKQGLVYRELARHLGLLIGLSMMILIKMMTK